MQRLASIILLGLFIAGVKLGAQQPPAFPPPPPCTPSAGEVQFVCGQQAPEDLVVVPGGQWVVAGAFSGAGGINLSRVSDRTTVKAYPTASANHALDAKTYKSCPGAPEKAKVTTHGLSLREGRNGVHTLYVVHHGTRESIEVFEVNAGAAPPILTWVGCAPAPPKQVFNGVVALPDGGFAATSNSADVRHYLPATGWNLVPGSEGTAPNGLEISKDGQWLYIAGWAEEKLTRLSRGRTPIQKDVIKLGFRPDNVRLSPDGSVLFAAGHTDKDGRSIVEPREPLRERSNVARIDPRTLEFRRIFQHPAIDGFVTSTTGIQIGNELWLGSQRGDRIAFLPMPK